MVNLSRSNRSHQAAFAAANPGNNHFGSLLLWHLAGQAWVLIFVHERFNTSVYRNYRVSRLIQPETYIYIQI